MAEQKAELKVYACGGTPAGIIATALNRLGVNEKGKDLLAKLDVTFVDTSRSDLPAGQEDRFYHVTDEEQLAVAYGETDGSGKDRRYIVKAAEKHAPLVIRTHKPSVFNVVMHSGFGGSGSVIGQLITKQLLESGRDVVVIMIGGEGDKAGIENTQRTIYGYENFASELGRSVPVHYLHIDRNNPVSIVYAQAIRFLGMFSAVVGGFARGLDTRDIHNFLCPEIKTSYKPSLVGLAMTEKDGDLEIHPGEAVSGLISLLENVDQAEPPFLTPYHTFGVYDQADNGEVFSQLAMKAPLRLCTVQNYFGSMDTLLKTKLRAHSEEEKAVPQSRLAITSGEVTKSGLVL